MATKRWMAEGVLELMRGYQPACILAAAAELDIFTALRDGPLLAEQLVARLASDPRGTGILLDALAGLGLLDKDGGRYAVPAALVDLLAEGGKGSVLAGVRHQANCLRRWAQLGLIVKTGVLPERTPSIRGAAADQAAFIEAMNEFSRSMAPRLLEKLGDIRVTHVLDVGGGPGTWTIAFLRRFPEARAILFDLPEVIPIARRHLAEAGLSGRTDLVAGDFTRDPLPPGADLAWVSAIAHQNSRAQNRELFAKVHAALAPGGRIVVRDVVMDESRTSPPAGALFAVNMLAGTPGGGTFTFGELAEDLSAGGLADAHLLHRGQAMDTLIIAVKAVGR